MDWLDEQDGFDNDYQSEDDEVDGSEPDETESVDDDEADIDPFLIGGAMGFAYEEGLRERKNRKRKKKYDNLN